MRAAVIGIALGLGIVAGTQVRAQSMQDLYQAARTEKTLHLYGAGPAQNYEGLARKFEAQFPDIKVTITGGYSNELNAKIEDQGRSGRFEADMGVFQTVQDFVRWKKDGLLMAFKPAGFDTIDASFKDPDGAYVAVYVATLSYAYNTKLVDKADVPASALDFLQPQFKGKLITAYPHDDDATLYLFHTLIEKYGWDFITRYMAQSPKFIQGHLGVARSVASGESLATFDATISTAGGLKRSGQPIELAFSQQDPTPVFPITAGIFKGAPHPNAAKLYLTWLLAPEQQAASGFFSPRADVAAPMGLPPLFSNFVINQYRAFVTNDALIGDLRTRFEKLTGPVTNAGGIK